MSDRVEQTDLQEGYKQVQIGPKSFEIPEEWGVKTIPDLCNLDTESFDASGHSEATFEYIDIESVSRGTIDQSKTIPIEEAPSRAKQIVSAGDTLVGKVRPYLQAFAPVTEEHDGKVCSTGFAVLSAKEEVSSQYITQAVLSKYFVDQMTNRMTGTSYPAVNKSDFQNVRLFTPPLPEQRRIADILSTVDEQIQQTDEVVEKTEELRTGLMNKFFHTGYYDHSTTTKGTLGEAPINWDVCSLSDVATVEMGSSPESEYYNTDGDGLPFFQANNEFGYRLPTHNRWCSESKKIAEKNDTLVTIRGTYVGQVNVAPERCCIGRGLAAVRATDVNQEYLYHHLAHRERYVRSIASGSTFDSINSTELNSLSVQVPPDDEQEKIASCLRNLQQRYIEESEYKKHLQDLKRGLMQDLLTGTVRIPPNLLDEDPTSDT